MSGEGFESWLPRWEPQGTRFFTVSRTMTDIDWLRMKGRGEPANDASRLPRLHDNAKWHPPRPRA